MFDANRISLNWENGVLLRRYWLSLFFLLFSASTLQAHTVYRWVDEQGQAHFSERPRPGMNDERIQLRVTPAAPSSQPDHTSETKTTPTSKPVSQPTSEKTVEVSPAQAQQLCRDAQQILTMMNERFNRRFIQPDGSVRPLTDEERAAQTRTANDAIARYCR